MLSEVFDGAWGTNPRKPKAKRRRAGVSFLTVGTKEMMRDTDMMLGRVGYGENNALLQSLNA